MPWKILSIFFQVKKRPKKTCCVVQCFKKNKKIIKKNITLSQSYNTIIIWKDCAWTNSYCPRVIVDWGTQSLTELRVSLSHTLTNYPIFDGVKLAAEWISLRLILPGHTPGGILHSKPNSRSRVLVHRGMSMICCIDLFLLMPRVLFECALDTGKLCPRARVSLTQCLQVKAVIIHRHVCV